MAIGERSRGNEIGGEGRNLSTAGWVSHWELDLDCEDKGNVQGWGEFLLGTMGLRLF